jgi:fucose permease
MTTQNGALTRPQIIAWRNGVFIVFLLPGLAMASWVSRLPAVRDVLGLGPAQVGLLVFGVAAGSIVGLIASSHIVARLGATTTIVWGVVVTGLGVAIAGLGATLGPSFVVTFIGLLVFGAATGITDVAMNVSGAANERALGRSIMPIFHAFFSFGTMIGAGLGALAQAVRLPILVHLGGVGVVMAVSAVTGAGLNQLLYAIVRHLDERPTAAAATS